MNNISTQEEFETTIGSGVTLLDFNAPWCGPCRAQEPILEKLATHYEGKASIAAMNVDSNRNIAGKLGIQSIPTLIIYKNGKELQRFIGLQSEDVLIEAIDRVLK